ncbi:ABC transporter permease [Pseudonocardia kujensis]|uniref:ABC transporter permease n=1 Tax=Pseudonocardia kujensis TaxID=1128675 RepID=UPI001E316534|nr:ABC transporter permease [Pseudonocardia kujensis]MCE0764547.1 ABC transporter permease [Pseudonocardia kujensis]
MLLLRHALAKSLWALPVAFGVVTVTFFVSRVFAGDPTNLYVPVDADESVRQAIRERLGLNDPLVVQFGHFLAGLLHGSLGESFSTGRDVTVDLWDRMPASLELGLLGLVLAVALGVPGGVIAAVHGERVPDFLVRGVSLAGLALPQFWLGLILVWLFAVQLGWLPGPQGQLPTGMAPPPRITGMILLDSALTGNWATWWAGAQQLVLPVVTLGFTTAAPLARITRTAMVEALGSEYVRTAVAMGHHGWVIPFKYALRNALLPIVTTLGGTVGFVFSGVILLESIFAWPGMGQYALQAIQMSDFTGLQGFVIYAAILHVIAYVVVDVLYLFIDPRTRS